jgi:hypothetical protein
MSSFLSSQCSRCAVFCKTDKLLFLPNIAINITKYARSIVFLSSPNWLPWKDDFSLLSHIQLVSKSCFVHVIFIPIHLIQNEQMKILILKSYLPVCSWPRIVGERAFCSSECRCHRMLMDGHTENCGSEAFKTGNHSASPCSAPMVFSPNVAAA